MKHGFIRNDLMLAGLACSLMLLSACATTAVDTKIDSIEQRATARWEALLGGDLQAAYEYLSPATRSSINSLQYQRSVLLQKVRWTGAQYIEESCEETTCKVTISLDYVIHGALPGIRSFEDSQVVEESWVLVDGVWYFVPSR